jgi:hypothetical protein
LTGNERQQQCEALQLFAINRRERAVKIELVAQDPNSSPQNSPTLYKTDRGSWVIQGYVVTDPEALSQIKLPEGETVVEIPRLHDSAVQQPPLVGQKCRRLQRTS